MSRSRLPIVQEGAIHDQSNCLCKKCSENFESDVLDDFGEFCWCRKSHRLSWFRPPSHIGGRTDSEQFLSLRSVDGLDCAGTFLSQPVLYVAMHIVTFEGDDLLHQPVPSSDIFCYPSSYVFEYLDVSAAFPTSFTD